MGPDVLITDTCMNVFVKR